MAGPFLACVRVDGEEVRDPLSDLSLGVLRGCRPVRCPGVYARQRHMPGRWFSTTAERFLEYESLLEQLTHAVADWQLPAPVAPGRPHSERMREIAAAIKAHAGELFPAGLAQRASMLACHTHTDLTWPQIAALHDLPVAHVALIRETVARYRNDPDIDERYQQLLKHAHRARSAAGYRNARLARGLTTPPRQEDPMTDQHATTCQTDNFA